MAALNYAGGGTDYQTVGDALTGLDQAGVINRQEFLGLDDLAQFRFFTNSFDTRTKGVDIVGNMSFDLMSGFSTVTVAFNYNDTEVTDRGSINPITVVTAVSRLWKSGSCPISRVTFPGPTPTG